MDLPNVSLAIDEIVRRPILVLVCIPGSIIIVLGNRVVNPKPTDCIYDIGVIFLKLKLWSVYTDDNQSLIFIRVVPSSDIGECANTVNTGIRPEINQDDFTP